VLLEGGQQRSGSRPGGGEGGSGPAGTARDALCPQPGGEGPRLAAPPWVVFLGCGHGWRNSPGWSERPGGQGVPWKPEEWTANVHRLCVGKRTEQRGG